MIDSALLRTNPDIVRRSHAARGGGPDAVDAAIEADRIWRAACAVRDAALHAHKAATRVVETAARSNDGATIGAARAEAGRLAELAEAAEAAERAARVQRDALVGAIENIIDDDCPPGDEDDCVIRAIVGQNLSNSELDHVVIGVRLGILDLASGARTAGARFF